MFMLGCIQNICAVTTQIESSMCRLVEQKMIYGTLKLCIIRVCNHILFEDIVSKSNFILTVLYLRIHVLMHHFSFGF